MTTGGWVNWLMDSRASSLQTMLINVCVSGFCLSCVIFVIHAFSHFLLKLQRLMAVFPSCNQDLTEEHLFSGNQNQNIDTGTRYHDLYKLDSRAVKTQDQDHKTGIFSKKCWNASWHCRLLKTTEYITQHILIVKNFCICWFPHFIACSLLQLHVCLLKFTFIIIDCTAVVHTFIIFYRSEYS